MKAHYSRTIMTFARAVALLSIAFLVSCDFSTQANKDGSKAGLVSVTFAALSDIDSASSGASTQSATALRSARTVLPVSDPAISRYELWGAKDGADPAKLMEFSDIDAASLDLEAGTWNFTLKAFNADGTEFLTGANNGFLLESGAVTVAFILEPLETGNGSVQVTVDWSTTGVAVSGVEVYWDNAVVTPVPEIASSKVTYAAANIPAGTRLLTFYLKNEGGAITCSVSEMVRVYPGMTSEKTIALAASDFGSAPAAPSEITISRVPGKGASSLTIVSWTDNSNNEALFRVYRNASASPSYFVQGGTHSYTISLPRGLTYTFSVDAFNGYGISAKATSASYTVPLLCTVTYSVDEATMTTSTVEAGEKVSGLPTSPKKAGYTFGGWWTERDGYGDEFTAAVPVTASMTVYAKWAAPTVPTGTGGIGVTLPQAATVTLTAPATVTKGSSITASASCSQTADSWSWYLDGSPVSGQTTTSFSGGETLGKGPHTLMAVALVAGNAYSASQTVMVQ